jgi:Putative zinc-finger
MKNQEFARLLSQIRDEKLDDEAVNQAKQRVWESVSAASSVERSAVKLRSCADFQSMIPAYVDRHLPEARTLLMEDHVHQCVACQHKLDEARPGHTRAVASVRLQLHGDLWGCGGRVLVLW